MNHPEAEVGIYASMLYLESLNVLGSHTEPERTACYEDMARDVPLFLDLYCKGSGAVGATPSSARSSARSSATSIA